MKKKINTGIDFFGRERSRMERLKHNLAIWCSHARKGQKIIICSQYGDFVLEFKGKWKKKPSKIDSIVSQKEYDY